MLVFQGSAGASTSHRGGVISNCLDAEWTRRRRGEQARSQDISPLDLEPGCERGRRKCRQGGACLDTPPPSQIGKPPRSSKSASACSPCVGGFDSCAAPLDRDRHGWATSAPRLRRFMGGAFVTSVPRPRRRGHNRNAGPRRKKTVTKPQCPRVIGAGRASVGTCVRRSGPVIGRGRVLRAGV